MDLSDGRCINCGEATSVFSSSVSESDGNAYCTRCAEGMDLACLSRMVCTVCIKNLNKQETKLVMPSRMYSSYFFDKLPMLERLMCVGCYRKAKRLNILHRPLTKISIIRKKLGLPAAPEALQALD